MSDQGPPKGNDMRFLVVAAALMVVITALLAGLWLSMRARAIRAESELARLRPELRRNRKIAAVFERVLKDGSMTVAVERSQLPTVTVKLDGREVEALKLGARLGRSMGFAPGDVIIVQKPMPATATAPAATRPAG